MDFTPSDRVNQLRERIESFGYEHYFNTQRPAQAGLVASRSLGYIEFLCLMDHARLVLTDSGGIPTYLIVFQRILF